VYVVANPKSLQRDIGWQVQAIAQSAGKSVPPLDRLNGSFAYTTHFLIPMSAITYPQIKKCWKKIMLNDTLDWMMDYKLETNILNIATKVSQCIQHPVPVLHSRLYFSLTITNAQDQSCSDQDQRL
jgi:hypothetical protein